MDKYAWTLISPPQGAAQNFKDRLLDELPVGISKLLPTSEGAAVTLQAPGEYSGALYREAGDARPFDALLEVEFVEACPPLDAFHEWLGERCGFMQGWRVRPTLIYDSSEAGDRSEEPFLNVFVQRLDGTTPEHFDRNWFIHAGHPDGNEAESDASRAERQREEALAPNRLYRQNRILEPVTPTTWLVHGYTQLRLGMFVPPVGDESYGRVRGEEAFDRWPPRILQGFEHRIS